MTAVKRLFSGVSLSCRRGNRMLFQNLCFDLNAGALLHLIGPNGAGKTSLLRMMAGLLTPSEGNIIWEQENIAKEEAKHAARLSFLPAQDTALKSSETAWENLVFWARLWGLRDMEALGALEAMRIAQFKDKSSRQLSAGQRRRVSLARLIMKKSSLWLVDEPFIALDAEGAALFRQALQKHVAAGGIAVVASHQSFGLPNMTLPQMLNLGVA